MHILMCKRVDGAFGFITDGFCNALKDRGHAVERWDGQESSWFNFKPDLYCGASGHRQPIPPRRAGCKVAIHVNPYGPVAIKNVNESEETVRWVINQKPDVVFGYGQEDDRLLWSYWTTKHGIPWWPMPTAGDKVQFKQTVPLESRPYDVVYLGGRWAYKGRTIDKFLIPVLRNPQIKSKLYGWGDWPTDLCGGVLPNDKACEHLNSGSIGPCVAEQHTHDYSIDIPERAFKVALCGGLVVHDSVPTIKRMIPSALVATTPEMFFDYCLRYSRPEAAAERMALAKQQQAEVLAGQTYHHRLAGMFDILGYSSAAAGMLV